jgi:glycerol-3-phosphate dehydrogenase (NAD(P)+)
MKIAVIGAGSWGTALALVAARANHQTVLWMRSADHARAINENHLNPRHLTAHALPESLLATHDLRSALDGARLVVLALPSHATREIANQVAANLTNAVMIVSATKGIEETSGMRISEIVAEELPRNSIAGFVALSGPSFAEEVAAGQPTAVVAASEEREPSETVQRALGYSNFRIYTNTDLIGVELGGAAKNTMALAAGMCAGVGLGTNSQAALITRGLAEIKRLATAYGGQAETLAGLAGLGDLVLTCTGRLSRNRHVGEQLGRGRRLMEVLGEMSETAEGVRTTIAVRTLAARRSVEMPITEEVYRVLYEEKPVADAVGELMGRPPQREFIAKKNR